MAEVTVKQLAQVVGTPIDKLLEQLSDAGIAKAGESDMISDSEKLTLLTHLRESRGQAGAGGPAKKITLKRKRVSELKTDASGRRKVNVEVRSKRTYVRPGEEAAEESAEAPTAPVAEAPISNDADTPVVEAPSVESAAPVEPQANSDVADQVAAQAAKQASDAAAAAVAAQVEAAASAAASESAAPAEVAPVAAAPTAAVDPAQEAMRQAEAQAAAAVVAAQVEQAAPPAAPAVPVSPEVKARQIRDAERRLEVEQQARAAAERMAEKQVAAEKRKESDENAKRDRERREQERVASELQRRAAMEAQQAASTNDRGASRSDKPKGKSRGKGGGGGGGGGDTRYGRNQLHVAKGKSGRRKGKAKRALPANFEAKHGFERPTAPVIREVDVPETITVAELANKMAVKAAEVIKAMMAMGVMATINQILDQDTAILVVEEMGHKANPMSADDVEAALAALVAGAREGDAQARPPVVAIMGHVDHGKTSLLDAIRKAKVVSGEAGGITQHIGAYQVTTDGGQVLSFLDTPGHAAFTSMRSRGAQVTDIVILVVAADDAVMPQTIEAIAHAKAANVPMIVAINKIDKHEANPTKVRTDLLQHEVIVEKMSGEVQDVEVSAHTGEGLDELLEAIALQSELLELKANPDRAAQGAVIEAKLDVGRGPVATVLIQTGTLRVGDIFVVGEKYGKVRALINDKGERIKEAGPSVPVEVLGLNGTPAAGDVLNVTETEAQAREIAEYREKAAKDKRAAAGAATTLEQLMANAKADEDVSELPIVVKADVQGSAEAIVQAMEKIGNEEVRVRVLHSGVGAITETDVGLAEASNAPIIGFNVRANASARNTANQKGVEIRYYSVIYDLVDDVKAAASGLLSNEIRENFIGYATIKEVFKVTGVGKVAGCMVTEGVARRSAGVRLLRDNVVIHEGTLKTLKRFKDEVPEVKSGFECGMAFERYEDIRADDVIEIFEREEITRTLA